MRVRAAALALALSLGACGDGAGGHAMGGASRSPRPVRVTTAAVSTRPLAYTVQAIGSLEAYQVVTVPARLAGTLEEVAFEEGDGVTPARVLAVIDGERHHLEVVAAESAVSAAEAAVTKADATVTRMQAQIDGATSSLNEAKANLVRREELNAKAPGSVMAEDLATARSAVARMKSALDEADAARREAVAAKGQSAAAVVDAKARLALVEKTRSDSEVRSPISGVVQSKSVSAGQYVKEGAAIAVLVDTRTLRLRFRVAEGESVRLVKGPHVTFRAQAMPQRTFHADLFHVNETADPQTRMVECLATVLDPDPALRPGFFANVTVETGRSEAALVVDENAVLSSEAGFGVFVVEGTKARRRAVIPGLVTGDGQREILSGLVVGDQVVILGASALQDGMAVEVAPPPAPAPEAAAARPPAGTPSPPPVEPAAGAREPPPPPGGPK